MVLRGHEDGQASDCKRRSKGNEGKAEVRMIGGEGHDETQDECCGGPRDGIQLHLHTGVAGSLDHGRSEVGEGFLK